MKTSRSKFLVGNREWCALPEMGVPAIKARVDSGAKTSSLHAFDISAFKRNSKDWVRFEIHPLQKNRRVKIQLEREIVDRRLVRSSSGESELRYVIKSTLSINGVDWPIELTLTNRDSMGYRMLLGREAMRGRMLIDPDEAYLLGHVGSKELARLYK
jgi:ribosomal protein S6--L-glutamate ligase